MTLPMHRLARGASRLVPPLVAVLAVAGSLWGSPAAAVVVDEFSTAQGPLADPPGAAGSVSTGGGDILGQRRGLVADLLSGAGPVSAEVTGGFLTFVVTATTPDSRGAAIVTWDGDTDPNTLSATGLGSADLTASGHTAFAITVDSADAGAELVLEVYTDAANASRAALRLPAVAASTDFYLSYGNDFVTRLGSGADFTDVGAIVLTVRGTEVAVSLGRVATAAASLSAAKTDLTLADAEIGTSQQPPGTTFKYRVTITNTGSEARQVDLADMIDANTSLSAATVDATPVAVDDAYEVFGNVGKSVSAADGLLANDVDPDQNGAPPELVVDVSGSPLATALGGSVALFADGSFDYDPPVGVGKAVDTFAYTVTDNEGNATTATAKLHIGRVVWFVDDVHPGADLGTRDDPFVGLDAANLAGVAGAGDQDGPDDILYFYAGTHVTGHLELEAGQILTGEGVALVLDGETVLPAGSQPTLTNAAGHVVTLATDNQIRGLSLGAAAAAGFRLRGSSFGTLTMSSASVSGAGGALDLSNGTLAVALTALGASAPAGRGIQLAGVGGTLTVSGATSVTASGDDSLRIANSPAGASFQFGTGSLDADAGSGLELQSNAATASVVFSSLAVTTDAGPGVFGSSGGTLTIGGTSNSVVAAGGAAVDLSSTSLGTGATFATVSSSGSAGTGVNLDTVTGAFAGTGGSITGAAGIAFDVNAGTGAISYGGTITNAANRAVEVTGRTTSSVTLSGNVSDAGTGVNIASNSGGTVTLSGTFTGTAATSQIDVTSNSGTAAINFTGATKTLSTGAANAIDVTSNGTATVNFTGGGLAVITTSGVGFNVTGGVGGVTVQGSANTLVSTTGSALNVVSSTIGAAGLTFRSITAGTAASGPSSGIVLSNTGANAGLTVTGTGGAGTGGTIQRTTSDGVSLTNTRSISLNSVNVSTTGRHGIHASGVNGLTLTGCQLTNSGDGDNEHGLNLANVQGTVAVSGTTLSGAAEDLIHLDNSNTHVMLQVDGASQLSFPASIGGFANDAILLIPNGTSAITATITGNTFTNVKGDGVQMGAAVAGSSGTSPLTVSGNTFNVTLAGRASSVTVSGQESTTSQITITGNTFSGAGGNGVIGLDANDSSTISGTVSGNVIGSPPGIGIFVAADEGALSRVVLDNNTITSSGGDGIEAVNFGGVGVSNMDLVITNNTINGNSLAPAQAFLGGIGFVGFEDDTCLVVRGNTVTGTPGGPTACGGAPCFDYYLEEVGGSTRLEEVPNTGATTASVAYVQSINNPAAATVTVNGVIDLTNGALCPRP